MGEELAEKSGQFQRQLAGWSKAAWRGILGALTPAHCLVCQSAGIDQPGLCVTCWQKLRFLDDPVCDVLGTPFAYDQGEGALSPAALTHPPVWNRSRAAVIFDEHSKEIVHAFKYGDRGEAGLFMAQMMARAGRKLISEADMIVPVPLHWKRLWKRRFNQAAILAQRLGKLSGKPYAPQLLRRIRATPQQVGLDAEARARNMRRAFGFAPGAEGKIKGKAILLVDDVRTTGATLSACVEALKRGGAVRVDVLSFALVDAPFRPHIEPHHG
jgi:ComF family protein